MRVFLTHFTRGLFRGGCPPVTTSRPRRIRVEREPSNGPVPAVPSFGTAGTGQARPWSAQDVADRVRPPPQRLVGLLAPRWLRIGGYFNPRGGMPIDVFWQTGAPPDGVWIADQAIGPYVGRG